MIKLYLFGSPRIEINDTSVNIPRRKSMALLIYLLVTRQTQRRDALVAMLWPESDQKAGRASLRRELHHVNQTIPQNVLQATRDTIEIASDIPAWIDIEAFRAQISDHLSSNQTDISNDNVMALATAVKLYQNEFMSGFTLSDCPDFDEWQFFQGDELRAQFARLLQTLIAYHESHAHFDEAVTYARRWLALDTMHEPSHRTLMRLFARAGHQAAATRQYDECVRILDEELGVPPEEETVSLYEAIRSRKLAPPKDVGQSQPETAVISKSTHRAKVSIPVEVPNVRVDWGESPDVRFFYGRESELTQLEEWVSADRCRLVAILGMGGMGKTALTARLMKNFTDDPSNTAVANPPFERMIWRSLLNAPLLTDILPDWLMFLSDQQITEIPATLDQQMMRLLNLLREQRCLLVLDNMESILEGSERQTGEYRDGYQEYGQLLERIGGTDHQSCLIVTSRERPQIVRRLEGDTTLVRSLPLSGLKTEASKQFLQERGLINLETDASELVSRYSGNPLALKLIAETIQDLFAGDVELFLAEETLIFDDIRSVLDQQFSRLSPIEREIIIWLMIEREAVNAQEIWANLAQPPVRRSYLEALRSLERRSLLTKVTTETGIGFTLQNVVIEYTTDQFIEKIYGELNEGPLNEFSRFALIKAQAKDYIRESQKRLILKPIATQLANAMGLADIETLLQAHLTQIQAEASGTPSYSAGNILNLLLYLGSQLNGLDLSHLPVRQAYLREAHLTDVSFAQSDLTGSVFLDTFGPITTVSFTPDGKQFAVGTNDGQIRFWRVAGNVPTLTLNAHSTGVMSITFTSDGKQLISGGDDHQVHFWDVQTGQRIKTLAGDFREILSVAVSPDDKWLACGNADKEILLWDIESGTLIKRLHGHTDWVWTVRFSPDGTWLASGGEDNRIRLWNLKTYSCSTVLEGHSNQVRSISFHPDGKKLASASFDQTIGIWDIETGERCQTLVGHVHPLRDVTFSPDGQHLASCGNDQTIKLWHVASGQLLNTLTGHGDAVWAISFSPNGQTLLSGCFDQTAKLWELQTGNCIETLSGYSNWIRTVAITPDGEKIISGSEDGMVRFWEFESGACSKTIIGHMNQIWSATISPNGKMLATTSGDRSWRLWDIETGQLLRTEPVFTKRIRALAFSPDGALAAGCIDEETLAIWDLKTGAQLRRLAGHTKSIWDITFDPTGTLLASGSNDNEIRLWDVQTGQTINVLKGHTLPVLSVAFSPDGQQLVSGSDDHSVRLWDVAQGEQIAIVSEHTNWVWSVAFSPDGKTIVSGSSDQTILVWDVDKGEKIKLLSGHRGAVLSLTFAPDGNTLVSGSTDQTIRIWDINSGACLRTIQNERPYERMNIIGATGLTKAQSDTLRVLGAIEQPI
ncbi:MAG: BTAD domain-containing putative transcriptional regulator [Chloroflexota bacterium]